MTVGWTDNRLSDRSRLITRDGGGDVSNRNWDERLKPIGLAKAITRFFNQLGVCTNSVTFEANVLDGKLSETGYFGIPWIWTTASLKFRKTFAINGEFYGFSVAPIQSVRKKIVRGTQRTAVVCNWRGTVFQNSSIPVNGKALGFSRFAIPVRARTQWIHYCLWVPMSGIMFNYPKSRSSKWNDRNNCVFRFD